MPHTALQLNPSNVWKLLNVPEHNGFLRRVLGDVEFPSLCPTKLQRDMGFTEGAVGAERKDAGFLGIDLSGVRCNRLPCPAMQNIG